ncbi:MAG: helix-turn-helix domain-containing protein [Bacteroidia bacterium]|nr:helix-turn-helix domain-containing protein [Bacteroidia bacterium]
MKIDKNRPMYSLSVEEYMQLNQEILANFKSPEAENEKNNTEIMDIDEAAIYLKMAKQTVYSMTSKKTLPYFKRGKRIFFRKVELLGWLEKGRKYTNEELLAKIKQE